MIGQWFEQLSPLGRIFSLFAIPSTLILLIQIVMSLFGMGEHGADGDVDVDVDNGLEGVFGSDTVDVSDTVPDGLDFKIFSTRSLIGFFVTFGWMGLSMVRSGAPNWLSVLVALASGLVVMVLIALMMRAIYRLQSDGTTNLKNALGASATVYLTIPPARSGKGKVNFILQGSYTEREAITDSETPLPYGTEVLIVGISGGAVLVRKK
ncbi:MAG: hypothetical protein WDA00_07385 [Eubacteriales bacterium]